MVDNLRLRSKPSLSAGTVATIGEDKMVQFWGERSIDEIEVTLRGRLIKDHWYLVKHENQVGWVFGGALGSPSGDNHQGKDSNDFIIIPGERVGLIKSTDSEQSIIDRLGGEHVTRGDFAVVDGSMIQATYCYAATDRELLLLWDNEDFTTLREIRLRKSNSPWQTIEGIKVGSTLKEVATANESPFELAGFGFDYGGTTVNWQSGSFPDELTLVFEPQITPHEDIMTDQIFSSDNRYIIRCNPVVNTIRILFNN